MPLLVAQQFIVASPVAAGGCTSVDGVSASTAGTFTSVTWRCLIIALHKINAYVSAGTCGMMLACVHMHVACYVLLFLLMRLGVV